MSASRCINTVPRIQQLTSPKRSSGPWPVVRPSHRNTGCHFSLRYPASDSYNRGAESNLHLFSERNRGQIGGGGEGGWGWISKSAGILPTGPYLASNVGVAALASVLRPGVSPFMLCNLVCSKYPCYLSIIFLVFSGSGTCSCFIICSCKEVIILHCH